MLQVLHVELPFDNVELQVNLKNWSIGLQWRPPLLEATTRCGEKITSLDRRSFVQGKATFLKHTRATNPCEMVWKGDRLSAS